MLATLLMCDIVNVFYCKDFSSVLCKYCVFYRFRYNACLILNVSIT